ncbi:MAG: hypothetical protein GTN69_12355 [Armatimonadetes bacterium]|nr:hypothetical protein [Armatimonadota bacterium]
MTTATDIETLADLGYFGALPFGNALQVMFFLRERNRQWDRGYSIKRLARAAKLAIWAEA